MPLPVTVAECDFQLSEYRRMLSAMSPYSRPMVWDQIDALLDERVRLAERERMLALPLAS